MVIRYLTTPIVGSTGAYTLISALVKTCISHTLLNHSRSYIAAVIIEIQVNRKMPKLAVVNGMSDWICKQRTIAIHHINESCSKRVIWFWMLRMFASAFRLSLTSTAFESNAMHLRTNPGHEKYLRCNHPVVYNIASTKMRSSVRWMTVMCVHDSHITSHAHSISSMQWWTM